MKENIDLMNYDEEMEVEPDKIVACPIYSTNEDAMYFGNICRIENFTHINFGELRTCILNNKPYFCARDVYRALGLPDDHTTRDIKRKVERLRKFYLRKMDEIVTPPTRRGNPIDNLVIPSVRRDNSINEIVTPPTRRGGVFYKSIEQSLYEISTQYYYIPTTYILKYRNDGSPVYRTSNMMYICEGLLYDKIFDSDRDEAIEFRFWVCNKVLPTLSYFGRDKSVEYLNYLKDEVDKLNNTVNIKNAEINNLKNDINTKDQSIYIGNNQIAFMNNIINGQASTINSNMAHIRDLDICLQSLSNNKDEIEIVKDLLFRIIECLSGFASVADNR